MFVVVIEYPANLPEVVGPFNTIEEADNFEKHLIFKIQSSEYENKEVSPATYIHPVDGYYFADFNPEYHPGHHPVKMTATAVVEPWEFNK